MTKISIIIPVYNSSKYLKETIMSVVNQSFDDIEIICIDDGSFDNSLDILNELSNKHDFIKVLRQSNQGSGKARNYGLDNAKGEYIAFLDADDIYVDKNALEILYNVAIENNADVVCGNLKKLTQDRVLIDNPNCIKNNYYCFDEISTISPNEYGVPWAFYKNIFKKSFLDDNNIRFKDLIRGQDPVFLSEVLANADILYGVPVDFYAYMFPLKGRPYYKVNTPVKKLHYITHYKDTFDILEKAGLFNLSEKYKPKFIKYLNYSIKTQNLEIYQMIIDVFGVKNNYFNNFQDEYNLFIASHMLHMVLIKDSNEFFFKTREKLNKLNIFNNKLLSEDLLDDIKILFTADNFEEYKIKYSLFRIKKIKKEHDLLIKKNNSLITENTKLEIELKNKEKFNNNLLNSNTWKLTSILRKIKKNKFWRIR